MATTPGNALTTGPSFDGRGRVPLWVWLLVLALGALAVYGGYIAVANYQLYYDAETARQALARDKDRLEANVADLKRQAENADKARTAAENALKQSHADTKTASDQVDDLQGQLGAAQGKIKTMEDAVAAAESKAKQATEAKAALEKEVDSLKSRLSEIQIKLDKALSDLAAAQRQGQTPPATPAPAPAEQPQP
jgi:chromosome segregation ATPase